LILAPFSCISNRFEIRGAKSSLQPLFQFFSKR